MGTVRKMYTWARPHIGVLGGDIDQTPLVLANPLQGQRLAIPRDVRLGDTPTGEPAILWQLPDALDRFGTRHDWDSGGTGAQAFWRFLNLADARNPKQFLAFARRFGTLGLWPYVAPNDKQVFGIDYWVPGMRDGIRTPHRYATFESSAEYHRIKQEGLGGFLYEPISEWQRWSAWFRAVVEIALQLRLGHLGSRQHWEVLDVDPPFSTDRQRQQGNLARYVQQRFMTWSGLTPIFRWDDDGPSLALQLGGEDAVHMRRSNFQIDWPPNMLYPALVAQLLGVITAGTPMATCSRCGKIHGRRRKARSDQPVYCSDECRNEAIKATKRKSAAQARQRPGSPADRQRSAAAHPEIDVVHDS